MACGQVAGFVRVVGKIEQLGGGRVGTGNQFPSTMSHPTELETVCWSVDVGHVVGKDLSVDRFASRVGGCGQGEQVVAGKCLLGANVGGGEDGRGQVDAAGQGLSGSGFEVAGPANHDRSADATFVGRTFRTGGEAETPSLGDLGLWCPLDPAVVHDEQDQGVVAELLAVQVVEQLPTGFVEPCAHGVITGQFDGSVRGTIAV